LCVVWYRQYVTWLCVVGVYGGVCVCVWFRIGSTLPVNMQFIPVRNNKKIVLMHLFQLTMCITTQGWRHMAGKQDIQHMYGSLTESSGQE